MYLVNRIQNKLKYILNKLVNNSEIYLGSYITPDVHLDTFIKSLQPYPKIAFVKQDILSDLYCCSPDSPPDQIIFSTLLRNGPFTLFTKLNADFWIVKPEEDEECEVWKEICFTQEGQQFIPFEKMWNYRNSFPEGNINNLIHPPEYHSVSSNDIDWGKYDIVISINISIPKRITDSYSKTTWCYCLVEPYMKSYKASSDNIIPGYDLFLNQRSRTFRINPLLKKHEIDFPYCLQYYGCYHELLNVPLDNPRSGIFIEKHTLKILTPSQVKELEKHGPIYQQTGTTREMLENLLKSKYFIRVGGNVGLRWANSIIESVAAGCLFIGNPNEFVNKSFFTPKTRVFSFEELIKRLDYFESNSKLYENQRKQQQRLVNWLCFCRPLEELFQKSAFIKSKKYYEKSISKD